MAAPTVAGLDSFAHQVAQTAQAGSGFIGTYKSIANSAVITFDTTNKRSSQNIASLKIAEDGVTAASVGYNIPASNRVLVWSYFLRETAVPSVKSQHSFTLGPAANAQIATNTDGTISYSIGGSSVQSVAGNHADGGWHLISCKFDCSGTTFLLDVTVDGVAGTQSTLAGQTAADLTFLKLGTTTNTHTGTFWFQDLLWSFTSGDHPILNHICLALYPAAEGTDNLLAHISDNAAGTTNLYTKLQDWKAGGTADITTYLQQTTIDAAAYAEVTFDQTTEAVIWGARYLIAGFAGSTAADTADYRVLTSGGTQLVASGLLDYSGSTTVLGYYYDLIAAPGGGWNTSALNGLKARWGFSTDVTPNPFLSAAMIEFAAEVLTHTVTHTTDAVIKATLTKTHSADANIKTPGAPTLAGFDSFAHQTVQAPQAGSDFSGTYQAFSNAPGLLFDTTIKRTADHVASLNVVEDGITATYVNYLVAPNSRQLAGSFYFRAAANPSVSSRMLSTTGGIALGLGLNSSGVLFYNIGGSGGQTLGAGLADGLWHRIDWAYDQTNTTFTLDVTLDGVAGTQSTRSGQTPTDFVGLRIGASTATHTLTFWCQDFVWSNTLSDHPIGAHAVFAIFPDGEGTDNLLSHISDNASGTTNLYQAVDDWAAGGVPDTATYIQQTANDGAAYAEITLSDGTETIVWDAQAIIAGFSSSTAVNAATARFVDSGGTTIMDVGPYDYSGSASVLGYLKQVLTRPAGAWTAAKLAGMKLRWGFSADTSPTPFLSAAMVEYVSPPSTRSKTQSADALIVLRKSVAHQTDALVKKTFTKVQSADAVIKKALTKSHSTDALVASNTLRHTHTTDAILSTPEEYAEGYGSGGYVGPTITHVKHRHPRGIHRRHLDIARHSPSELDEFRAALGDSHRIRVRVFVLNASETRSTEISQHVLTGQVDMDVTQDPNRWAQIDLLDPGYKLSATEPASASFGGLWAGSMLRVWYDVYVSSIDAWVTTPVFTGPVQTFGRDGAIVHIQCTGKESFLLAPNRYDNALSDITASTTRATLEALLDNVGEPQNLNWQGGNEKLDKDFDTLREFTNGQNSYLTLIHNIIGAQHNFYYDGEGKPTVRRNDIKGVLDLTDYVLTPVSQAFDMSAVRNRARALVTTKPPGTETVTVQPGESFAPGRLGRSGISRFLDAPLPSRKFRKVADARDAATSLLTQADEITVTLDILPIPDLDPHDRVQVTDSSGSRATFKITNFSFPLHVGDGMAINYNRKLLDPKNAGARFKRHKVKHGKH